MATRVTYDWEVISPNCAAQGQVYVSEDDHRVVRDPHFTVDEISAGFSVKKMGRSASDIEIMCDKCGIVV
jgi:hypothetical protein